MRKVELGHGLYGAHWGLTDLYPEAEDKLRLEIMTPGAFSVEWGCKKEIRYAKVVRDDAVRVVVTAHMDSLYEEQDLIADALWEVARREDGLPNDVVDMILEEAAESDISDYTTVWDKLPVNASYEDIMESVMHLEEKAEDVNTEMFGRLCDIVKMHCDGGGDNG